MKENKKNRGPGRPPTQKYFSGQELREQAKASIRQCVERRHGIESLDVDEFCDDAMKITGKHKFTRQEMDELRTRVDLLYNKYVIEKWEEEAELNREANAKLYQIMLESVPSDAPVKMMTEAEWHLAHNRRFDGSKRRGPAPKKKKAVWNLSPGEKGTADKPGEHIDIDQMEKEIEEQMMDAYIAERSTRPQQTLGKRLRKDHLNPPKQSNVKSFWV